MQTEVIIDRQGESLHLLGDRALFWPACARLMIADLHLGKADLFRRAGIAMPAGGTHDDLQRLQALLLRTGARELWVLGDLLHGKVHRSPWLVHWLRWRSRHPTLEIHVVAGNHDRALDATSLEVVAHGAQADLAPFLLRHDPPVIDSPQIDTATGAAHVLAGHLHPVAALPGLRRRFPAFWLRRGSLVLPAFSGFTAGVTPTQERGHQLVACVDGHAIALPESSGD